MNTKKDGTVDDQIASLLGDSRFGFHTQSTLCCVCVLFVLGLFFQRLLETQRPSYTDLQLLNLKMYSLSLRTTTVAGPTKINICTVLCTGSLIYCNIQYILKCKQVVNIKHCFPQDTAPLGMFRECRGPLKEKHLKGHRSELKLATICKHMVCNTYKAKHLQRNRVLSIHGIHSGGN